MRCLHKYQVVVVLVATVACASSQTYEGDSDGGSSSASILVDPQTGQVYELDTNRKVLGAPDAPDEVDGVGLSRSALIQSFSDTSGTVTIQTVSCQTTVPEHHPSLACSLDPEFVVVGGGATTISTGWAGALLTETRPLNDGNFRQWVASSKDHGTSDLHYLQVFVVGMKLAGVSRATLKTNMEVREATSGVTAHPFAEVTTTSAFRVIGGGARVNWSGSGNLLTESRPMGDGRTWRVGSKDHHWSSPASITAFVIGIRPVISGFGELELATTTDSEETVATQRAGVTVYVDQRWVVTCPGAWSAPPRDAWQFGPGAGRLLTALIPSISLNLDGDPSSTKVSVHDKDHITAAKGILNAYALQARRKP